MCLRSLVLAFLLSTSRYKELPVVPLTMNAFDKNKCFVCNLDLLNSSIDTVQSKGLATLIASSEGRNDGRANILRGLESVKVHKKCRKKYINQKSIVAAGKRSRDSLPEDSSDHLPVPESNCFSFASKCFFCDEEITEAFLAAESKKPKKSRIVISKVRDSTLKRGIIKAAKQHEDEWSAVVLQRIEGVDLAENNAQYHRSCYSKFCLPTRPANKPSGRPEDQDIGISMAIIYKYLEDNRDQCQFSLCELSSLVHDQASPVTIKRRLEEKYGEGIVITSSVGRTPIVHFRKHHDLKDAWYQNKLPEVAAERKRIVETAAAIIAEDIRSKEYDTDYFPDPDTFLDNVESVVPETLRVFLRNIIMEHKRSSRDIYERQCTAIAHSIIAATRPRSFASSLHIGLAAFLYSRYGSKHLINVLSALGYCASYSEAETFQLSAILHPEMEVSKGFSQFVADNADVNICTLDGLGTFHSMGMIQCVTPKVKSSSFKGIFRVTGVRAKSIVRNCASISIESFTKATENNRLFSMELEPIEKIDAIKPKVSEVLWMFGKNHSLPRMCGWNGFMEQALSHKNYALSTVTALPFVNNPPSEYDTIYTTLLCAAKKSSKAGQQTCLITFDQPLFKKARDILSTTNDQRLQSVVVRLGGFHMLMSFLGCIGFIMAGSGLREILSLIYARISVEKMLLGHAYSRAVRGHILVHLALSRIIFSMIDFSENEEFELEEAITSFDDGKFDLKIEDNVLKDASERFSEKLDELEGNGPTAQLWTQYFRMATLVKQFIEAERSSNWELHLSCIEKMLPFFHAAGHFNYALSARLYLQDMRDLQTKMNLREYRHFVNNGFFTIRRSNKFWSGIWSDMTIEQTLMRSMKTIGGVTRGRGVTDNVLTKWTLGMPIMQRVSESVEEFSNVFSSSTEQHVDARPSRQTRDDADCEKLVQWFSEHPPFPLLDKIVSLSSGVVGGSAINCHDAMKIGMQSMKDLDGKKICDVKFSRKSRVLSLSTQSSSIKIADEVIAIDPILLYQRISFTKLSQQQLEKNFEYELSPYPLSLFDDSGMRKTAKSAIVPLFSPMVDNDPTSANAAYIIDGGYLIHKVVWKKDETFSRISDRHVEYINKHYGLNVIIVFDGYPEDVVSKSTKTAERLRRSAKTASVDIRFDNSMQCSLTQDKFLSNDRNKSRLIALLISTFNRAGYQTRQADEDADRLIVQTALDIADDYESVFIVGNDTDLLVLLTGIAEDRHSNVFFLMPSKGKTAKSFYSTKSLKKKRLSEDILVCHALSGCDTTSALFNKGKIKMASLVEVDDLHAAMMIFKDHTAEPDEIDDAGEKILVALYGGKQSDTLNKLRYTVFKRSITKSKFNLASLPPTKAAARQHSLRAYHQIQSWLGHCKEAIFWGWKQGPHGLTPVLSSLEAAPQELLKLISCGCKTGCGKACGCRQAGLKCSEICTFCDGVSCTNARSIPNAGSDTDDEDDSPQIMLSLGEMKGAAEPTDIFVDDGYDWAAQDRTENVEDRIENYSENMDKERGTTHQSNEEDNVFQREPLRKKKKKD